MVEFSVYILSRCFPYTLRVDRCCYIKLYGIPNSSILEILILYARVGALREKCNKHGEIKGVTALFAAFRCFSHTSYSNFLFHSRRTTISFEHMRRSCSHSAFQRKNSVLSPWRATLEANNSAVAPPVL